MKKTIILLTICFASLFIINSCNKGTFYVNLIPEKSEIDYHAQTVIIRVERKNTTGVENSQNYSVGNPYFLGAVKDDQSKEDSKSTWYITGPWFKVTIPPVPVKKIKVEFSENDSGGNRIMTLISGGPYYGQCVITQTSK